MKKTMTVAKILTMSHLFDVTDRKYFKSSPWAASIFISDSSTFASIRIIDSSCSKIKFLENPIHLGSTTIYGFVDFSGEDTTLEPQQNTNLEPWLLIG